MLILQRCRRMEKCTQLLNMEEQWVPIRNSGTPLMGRILQLKEALSIPIVRIINFQELYELFKKLILTTTMITDLALRQKDQSLKVVLGQWLPLTTRWDQREGQGRFWAEEARETKRATHKTRFINKTNFKQSNKNNSTFKTNKIST